MNSNQKLAIVLIICGTVLLISAGCCILSQLYFAQYWEWMNSWTQNFIP